MNETFLNKVYNLLVAIGGAHEYERESFVYHHLEGCTEWRFQGQLGFGGKYYSERNKVSCYSEDKTEHREYLIKKLNEELAKLNS